MEYIIAVIKKVTFFNLLLLSFNCFSQNKPYTVKTLRGNWECVKKDYRGYQNYSSEQADAISKSILHIDENTYCFKNIQFIDRCSIYGWKMKPYDLSIPIQNMNLIYSTKELRSMFLLEPVDQGGNLSCYNNCVILLKKDTLITICGGYTFYWKKNASNYKGIQRPRINDIPNCLARNKSYYKFGLQFL